MDSLEKGFSIQAIGAGIACGAGAVYSRLIRILGLLCLLPLLHTGCGPSPGTDDAAYHRPRQLRYGFTVTNTTHTLVKKARLWTFVPLKHTPTQKRTRITASRPFKEIEAPRGNPALLFNLDDLAPYSSRVVTLKIDLLLTDLPVPVKIDQKDLFVAPEKFIEADHPEIVSLAKALKQGDATSTARQVSGWTADHLTYTGYHKKPRGALYALKQRQGDCTEFMDLFVALCRANNIPARGVGGYICRKNSILKPGGYHNWAEFYDGRTWRLADPQNRVFIQDQADYMAMKIIGDRSAPPTSQLFQYRVEGEGVTVSMNK